MRWWRGTNQDGRGGQVETDDTVIEDIERTEGADGEEQDGGGGGGGGGGPVVTDTTRLDKKERAVGSSKLCQLLARWRPKRRTSGDGRS